jgi:hypothetical protein
MAKRMALAQPALSRATTPENHEDETGDNEVVMTGLTEVVAEAGVGERTPLLDRKSFQTASPSSLSDEFNSELERSVNRTRIVLAIAYASFSGILSGMCLLFAKSGVELLVLTIEGHNQFWRWQAWMLLIGLVAFALLQLYYMHKALTLADPTLVCPCECHKQSCDLTLTINQRHSVFTTCLLLSMGSFILTNSPRYLPCTSDWWY